MSRYVLVHGAWHDDRIWEGIAQRLEIAGHHVATPRLPIDDAECGAADYAEQIASAARSLAGNEPLVIVGHTSAGLVLPLVPDLIDVSRLVYVNALLPMVGQSIVDQARAAPIGLNRDEGRNYDLDARSFWRDREAFRRLLAHDLPAEMVDVIFDRLRGQARMISKETTPLKTWPAVPSTAFIYADDRDLSTDRLRSVASERLGVEPIELAGSQLGFVAHPDEFVAALLAAVETTPPGTAT